MKKDATVSLKVTADVKKRLMACAGKQDRSMNWLATKFVLAGLEQEEKRSHKSEAYQGSLDKGRPRE